MPFKDIPNIRFKATPSKDHRHELLTSTAKRKLNSYGCLLHLIAVCRMMLWNTLRLSG